MTRLVHPETGAEFDAPERAVPVWQRSGWAVKGAPQPAGKTKAAGSPAGDTTSQEN